MSLILKTVNNNNISVDFNLQYSANEFTIKIKTWKKLRIVLLFSTKVVIIVVVVLRIQ